MQISHQLEIHYYFDNKEKHSMNAFIKAKSDIEILAIIHELGEIFNLSFKVQTEALSEGGLRHKFEFLSEFKSVASIISIATFLFSVYIYMDGSETRKLEIQERKLSIEEKELNLKKLRKELAVIKGEDDAKELAEKVLRISPKIVAKRTNYFKQIQQEYDISKIGYSSIDKNNKLHFTERIIEREYFSRMILEPKNPEPDQYEKIQIEIIAPILKKHKKAKWKGVFNDEVINFSVKDKAFTDKVFDGEISFTSGTVIICDLDVHKKINEVGEEIIIGYSVDFVHDYSNDGIKVESGEKQKKGRNTKIIFGQGDLFI